MTKVSEFTARIALLRPDLEPDGQGGYHDNGPKVVGHVWAQFLKPRFWDGQAGGGPATEITQGIVIRYRADILRIGRWNIAVPDTGYCIRSAALRGIR